MATYVDQAYYGWPHEELPRQDESQEVSASQMLDHGSISFGRFAYESLSWEKRSVFTYNKCQEELEKFKSPGLVAKKKAYFEEYYKKIRAMKALQESQQTEITLDYNGDGSISSQAGEEDETPMQLEHLGDRTTEDVVVQPEDVPVAASVEKETDCNEALEVQIEQPGLEIVLPDSDSLRNDSFRNNVEEHEQVDKTSRPDEMQHLDMDISVDESPTKSIEEPKQHDLSDLDDKKISRENSISVTNISTGVESEEKPLCLTDSKEGDKEAKPARKIVPRKGLPSVRKNKDIVSDLKVKEPLWRPKSASKLEDKHKRTSQKQSQGHEHLIEKTTGKYGNGVSSGKATADKGSRSNKPTIAASHRPLREVHSNVTTLRPFSLATDKRAAVPSGNCEGASKLISKSSNQRTYSVVNRTDATNVQGPSKRTAIGSNTKSKGFENKWVHEKRKKPVTLENQSTLRKPRDVSLTGPVKARSLNFPPRNQPNSSSGTGIRFKDGVKKERNGEGRHEAKVTQSHRADAKVFTAQAAKTKTDTRASPAAKTKTDARPFTPPTSKLRTETKKMVPSSMSSAPLGGRRPPFGERSLDGKKPRQEKPRWR